jgi:predicted ArsR family transcriptional regulator
VAQVTPTSASAQAAIDVCLEPPVDAVSPDVSGIAALADPIRHTLYNFVIKHETPVSRDDAAGGTGLARHVVKFNLDRLVGEGLLDVEYRRPEGRGGPGAGRPAKLYRRSERDFAVSVPARRYELAALLLGIAARRNLEDGIPLADALRETTTVTGQALGQDVLNRTAPEHEPPAVAAAIADVLDENGFEPHREGRTLTLGNCPFAAMLADCKKLICHMNLDLMNGLLERCGLAGIVADLNPMPGKCCVRFSGLAPA